MSSFSCAWRITGQEVSTECCPCVCQLPSSPCCSFDRDLFLLGDVWLDFMQWNATRRVSPYFVAGGGLMVHWPEHSFTGGPYKEGSFTAGFGARLRVGDKWYVAPEARIGWEPHTRLSVNVGYRVKP